MNMMMESGVLPKDADIAKLASASFLSDLSRELQTSLGHTPPRENSREEKVASILHTPV
jgi:hypothetical protein